MNKTSIIACITIPLGFLLEFLAYFFGTLSAAPTGISFLYFLWASLAFFGGLASWAFCGYAVFTFLDKETK